MREKNITTVVETTQGQLIITVPVDFAIQNRIKAGTRFEWKKGKRIILIRKRARKKKLGR